MKRIQITPRAGRRPVFPGTNRPVPAEGVEVNLETYWLRCERDGAIEIHDPQKATRAKRGTTAPADKE